MKKIIPIIIAVVVVGAGVVSWFYFGGKTAKESGKQEAGQQEEVKEGESFSGKLKDMVMRNVPLKCTYSDGEGNSGVGYVKNKKYYGEITTKDGTAYVVMADNCMWSWADKEDQGVKMCFDVEEGEDLWGDWENMDEEARLNTPQGSYSCRPATVSDSLFNPPQNIKFMDMNELMNFSEDMEDNLEGLMGDEGEE